jgi:hypothetical protein
MSSKPLDLTGRPRAAGTFLNAALNSLGQHGTIGIGWRQLDCFPSCFCAVHDHDVHLYEARRWERVRQKRRGRTRQTVELSRRNRISCTLIKFEISSQPEFQPMGASESAGVAPRGCRNHKGQRYCNDSEC